MKHPKLCWAPWLHTATNPNGDIKLCCIANNDSKLNLNDLPIEEIWNSNYYKTTRRSMINGDRIATCETCWKEEDLGIESHRMICNRSYETHLKEDGIQHVLSLTDESGHLSMMPPTIDIRLGNTCNLECIMCGPGESSKWVKRAKTLASNLETPIKFVWNYKSKIDTTQFEWYKGEKFWKDFETISTGLRHMTFGGGEPLYVKEHKNIIKYLVETNRASNISLHYHTNGTIYDQAVVDLWTHFKEVKVMLSIDGYGEVNEYIRRPAKWNVIEENLKLYDQTPDNVIVAINTTVQLLNALDLTKFAQWLLDQTYKKIGKNSDGGIFFASLLHYPDYLTIKLLPLEAKQEVSNMIDDIVKKFPNNVGIQRLKAVKEFMNSDNTASISDQTVDFIHKYNDYDSTSYRLELFDKYLN